MGNHGSGCVDGVMENDSELEIGESSSNSCQICCIYLYVNNLGKCMNPHPPSGGLNRRAN